MKSWTIENDKDKLFRITPLFVLCWGFLYFFFFEKIPVYNGFGWDGRFYGDLAANFKGIITSTGISSYYSQRIFPSAIIFSIINLFKFTPTTELIIRLFNIYNILLFFICSVLWIMIASKVNLNRISQWTGFILLFLNFPVLKFYPYYPVLTDPTAYFLGFLTIYAAVTGRSMLLLFVTFVSYFTWPHLAGLSIILFLFPFYQSDFIDVGETDKWGKLLGFLFLLLISVIVLWVIIYSKFRKNEPVIWYLNLALGFLCVVLFFFVTVFNMLKRFSFISFLKQIPVKSFLVRLSAVVVLILAMSLLKSIITNNNLPGLDAKVIIVNLIRSAIQLPFIFIIAHITFFGPSIMLCIIFYREIYEKIFSLGHGTLFASLFCLIFFISSESRGFVGFYPFLILLLMMAINSREINFRKAFIPVILILSLIFSKLWLPMNLPAIWNNDTDSFPFQRYFMNQGPWMNHKMFIFHTIGIFFCFFIILYCFPQKAKRFFMNVRILKPDK